MVPTEIYQEAKAKESDRNTKPPHSHCLCTENYSTFTHPPKTDCQNPCRCGFFLLKKGHRGSQWNIREKGRKKNCGRAREAGRVREREEKNQKQ